MDLDKYVKIWTPDSYISNAILEVQHSVTKLNVFIRVYPNGTLVKSTRLETICITCLFSWRWFYNFINTSYNNLCVYTINNKFTDWLFIHHVLWRHKGFLVVFNLAKLQSKVVRNFLKRRNSKNTNSILKQNSSPGNLALTQCLFIKIHEFIHIFQIPIHHQK